MKHLPLFLLGCASAFAAPAVQFTAIPQKAQQGDAVVIRAKNVGSAAEGVSLSLGEQKPNVWECGKSASCAVFAVPLDTKPGKVHIEAQWHEKGKLYSRKIAVAVRRGKFKINKLSVDPRLTKPSEEEQKQIAEDKKRIEAAFATPPGEAKWVAPFALPIQTGVTSVFGNQRMYNGEVQSIHFGVDLRAATGNPIQATQTGKVLLARPFFFAGNMVLLDHGRGVFSSYSHLSAFDVKEGDEVAVGQLVGKAGATGRATGPHLHWGTRVNGVPVNPLSLIAILSKVRS